MSVLANVMKSHDSTAYRKKLHYLIARRATLELEILLQRFWRNKGQEIADEDLPEIEKILLMEDMDLLDIFMGRRPVPPGYREDLFRELLESVREYSRRESKPE
jgi:succinate dehydrogenase flavin-adding protein (antitoxin of CptAB toxin-antitoxin module)